MIIAICKNNELLDKDFKIEFERKNNHVFLSEKKRFKNDILLNHNNRLTYFSSKPILENNNKYENLNISDLRDYKYYLENSENDFSGVDIIFNGVNINVIMSSGRITRTRMYFIRTNNALFLSPDLRLLIKYSDKRLRNEVVYGIIKYGVSPEYLTIVNDIYSVPISSSIEFNTIDGIFNTSLTIDKFKKYYRIDYNNAGGNISDTYSILSRQAEYFSEMKPAITISGGVDSTLFNFILNEHIDKKYSAYYIKFGENDNEQNYAEEAVKNTKAELNIINFRKNNFIDSIESIPEAIIEPVGESSIIAGTFFSKEMNRDQKSDLILDCTLADGCYGCTNYNYSPFYNKDFKIRYPNKILEKLSSYLIIKNIRGRYRLAPSDSIENNKYLNLFNLYTGALGNTIFTNSIKHNKLISEYYLWFLGILKDNINDEWAKYSVMEMLMYASKQTTAKIYDPFIYSLDVNFPFMFRSILADQGKYNWDEKMHNNIFKYPLKKLLEKYIDKSFIYRNKMGLNSRFDEWLYSPEVKQYVLSKIDNNNSIAFKLISEKYFSFIINSYKNNVKSTYIYNIILSLTMIQVWSDYYNLSIEK
ncbi:MAG: asparagine synthase-related protein [Ignavibacteriae bacterium]|nr:asparagine synthase-related protein [Ignavibacteriota bacterium]